MQNERVLVTGGTEFIGSNFANRLAERNDMIAVNDGYLGTPENSDDDVLLENKSVLDDELPTGVDVIFHPAALLSYRMHKHNPTKGVRVNVEGSPTPSNRLVTTATRPLSTPQRRRSTAAERNRLPRT
jgi:UDP-glucose 4-epimerase